MHRNTRRFGAAVMAAGSLLILSACSAPQTAPVVTKPVATAPAPATIVDSGTVSGASTLEDGNTLTGTPRPNDGETGTYVSGSLNLTLHCTPKVWDAEKGEITTQVTVTNNGSALEHVILVLDGMTPTNVCLANPDATLNGKAYIYFGPLGAGATSQARLLRFKSDSMVDYRCVTHVEARCASLPGPIVCEDNDVFLGGLELSEDLKTQFHDDFEGLLDLNASDDDRLMLAQLCLQRLDEVSDAGVREQLRERLALCLYTGFKAKLDDWLCYVTDEDLDFKIRLFVWECLQLNGDELTNASDYLRCRFEADVLSCVTDTTLADRLRSGFGEYLDFCQAQYLRLI